MSTVTFTWEPDPAVFARRFYAVAGALENRVAPLVAASEEMQASIRERFETETDPQGNEWKPLSDRYIKNGLRNPPWTTRSKKGTTLKDTFALMAKATSSKAIVITADSVFYETRALPNYGLAHEAGVPDRRIGKVGNPLPKRSFLGMSDDAQTRVLGYFYEWFEEAIDLYVTSTGKIGARHAIQGEGGFVSRASVGREPLPKF